MKKFIFIWLAVSMLLPSTVVLAQKETKISATWKIAVVRSDKINISGKENHTLALTEYKILSETVEDGTSFGQFKEGVIYGIEDLVQGTGSQEGYNRIQYGDIILIPEWSGKVTTSPSGAVTSEGTWGFVGGPFVGGGTYSGRFISPKEVIIEWEGEYHKKKYIKIGVGILKESEKERDSLIVHEILYHRHPYYGKMFPVMLRNYLK